MVHGIFKKYTINQIKLRFGVLGFWGYAQGFNKKCLKEYPENKLFGANIKKGSVEKSDWPMLVDEGSSITPKHRVSIIKICKDKNGLV